MAYDRETVALAAPASEEGAVGELYARSLLVLEQLTDRQTGATIAAPEFDPSFEQSGGYGFVWPRDLGYVVLSFLAAGRGDLAVPALRWLAREQAPEGLWLQRYWTDGSLAPSWGLHQLDETGMVLFAYEAAWRELGDAALDRELWPSASNRRGLPVRLHGRGDGLAAAERRPLGADRRAALLQRGRDLRRPRRGSGDGVATRARARRARTARPPSACVPRSRSISGATSTVAICVRAGSALRRARRGAAADVRPAAALPDEAPCAASTGRTRASTARCSASAWPFRAVDPSSPRMRATIEAVERELRLEDGGVLRHEDDDYAGGNPWLISTLWLGLAERQAGDEAGLRASLDYALARQTSLGLLPEQVTRDGDPAWVVPLGWSHAMLMLAARPELALVRDGA